MMPEERDPGSSPYMPRSPDPTAASAAAVAAATEVSRREIAALRELHDKDLKAFRELLDARLEGMDQDRARVWDRTEDIIRRFTTALTEFRAEVKHRDESGRELIEQRLTDLDKARQVAAEQIKEIPADIREARDRLYRDGHRELKAEREYHMAKLDVLATRTEEKFKAVDAGFAASKEAVAAALQAAKEAVAEQNRANSAAIRVSEGNTKEQLTALSQVSSANFKALEDKVATSETRLTRMESLTSGIEKATGEQRSARVEQRLTQAQIVSLIAVLIVTAGVVISLITLLRK